jgi:polyphosphate kinase
MKKKLIVRDISWLSFNGRVLQEAADKSVPLQERIRFLGIFSNNLDEFFRVRVATLSRMLEFGKKSDLRMHLEKNPKKIMSEIHEIVLKQQSEFTRIWNEIIKELKRANIYLKAENQLSPLQQKFVTQYFTNEVRGNIIPLMIESIPVFPNLKDKSIYLAVNMTSSINPSAHKFSIIEIPTKVLQRFVLLPAPLGQTHIILLEDVVRYNLKQIFSHLDFDQFGAWVFKVTRDAEIDLDSDVNTNLIQKIESGLKRRKRGKAVRLVYDQLMDPQLLNYLSKRLNLTQSDNIIPGGRIHNYRDFMAFPNVFKTVKSPRKTIMHPNFTGTQRVSDIILKKDTLLHFPYHSFDTIIDLLRESAIDPDVSSINITTYRVASNSKVMNALINAARNGKQVTVMLELRARFDEEANLAWKTILEEEGVQVLLGIENMKVHSKICVITKKVAGVTKKYGFVSTGNLNEQTAKIYADYCLLTSNRAVMNDLEKVFLYLKEPYRNYQEQTACKVILTCPNNLREELSKLIHFETLQAKKGHRAEMILKMNSLSDEALIKQLYEAAKQGVKIHLIIRGIFCLLTDLHKTKHRIEAISIVDEYLEHGRVFYFYHAGKEKVFISSADWMVRNLDHRLEVTCPIQNKELKKELLAVLDLQWKDNVKARILNNDLNNEYVIANKTKKLRSQVEILKYLVAKG